MKTAIAQIQGWIKDLRSKFTRTQASESGNDFRPRLSYGLPRYVSRAIIIEGTKGSARADQSVVGNIPKGVQSDGYDIKIHGALLDTPGRGSAPHKALDGTHLNEDASPKESAEDTERRKAILNLQLVLSLAAVTGSVAIAMPITVLLLGTKHTCIAHPVPLKVMGVSAGISLFTSVVACIFRILCDIKPDHPYFSLLNWVFLGISASCILFAFCYGIGAFLL